jgi:hypothetical protein
MGWMTVDSPLEASKADGKRLETNPGGIGMVARDVDPRFPASWANEAEGTTLSNAE